MNKEHILTQEQLKQILHYDPETGVFRWKLVMANNRNKIWGIAGSINQGYVRIRLKNKTYECHRLAFLYVTGFWPENDVDHIDGCRSNNKWENLRQATRKQNCENIKLRKNNTSGYRGVVWHKATGKWSAMVRHNKKAIWLGLYEDVKEAAIVAAAKRSELFTHDIGRDQIKLLTTKEMT